MSVRYARLRALAHERENGGGESCAERARFDRADVGILESSKSVVGKIVVASLLDCGQPLAEAGERERVVAHGADVTELLAT